MEKSRRDEIASALERHLNGLRTSLTVGNIIAALDVLGLLCDRAAEQRNEADADGALTFHKIRVCTECGAAWKEGPDTESTCPICGVMCGKVHLLLADG